VDVKLNSTATVCPPRGEPTVNQFFRLCGPPHKRKNWLHLGGDGGLQPTAVLLSVTASVKRHGIDPWAYLTYVLSELPIRTSRADRADLLPDAWAKSRGETCHRAG
jgi:hypothetical protein